MLEGLLLLSVSFSVALQAQTIITTYAGGAPPPAPITALQASISPQGIAFDGAGNLYFSSVNCVFKLDASGTVTLVAGNGRPNSSGDGGPAVNAGLFSPAGLAFDNSGNLLIADGTRIRTISPKTGIITTIAGTGVDNSGGNGGPASAASVAFATGIVVDAGGNIYFSEPQYSLIRKISSSGVISNFAGTAVPGYSGDNGPAAQAQLYEPEGLSIDRAGDLLIADSANSRIRRVTPAGVISTIVGSGTPGSSANGVAATQAKLASPMSVTVDVAGNVYLVDAFGIHEVSTSGVFTTIAGAGTLPVGGGGLAVDVQFTLGSGLCQLAFDNSENLFIAASNLNRILVISTTGVLSTAAGNGTYNYSGDGGLAINAQMGAPACLAFDAAGNLYIQDWENPIVRRITRAGIVTTIAGNGTSGFSGDGGSSTSAQLGQPGFGCGIAFDPAGNLYIADAFNVRIRKVSTSGTITTFAGGGTGGDGGPAISASLGIPMALAFDASGNLYISANNLIRKVSTAGIITTIAGTTVLNGFSGDGGPATNAQLNYPGALAVNPDGYLYIADTQNNRIRRVSPQGIITTIAGGGNSSYCPTAGVSALSAALYFPAGLFLDGTGDLYISNRDSSCVVELSPSGTVTTVAGDGFFGYSGDGAAPLSAELALPIGLALDSSGNLYVGDSDNGAIRLIEPTALPITIHTVVNAASNAGGLVAPGEIVVLTGTGLGPAQLVSASPGSNGLFGTTLAGTSVSFDGIPAPMIYASATQVAAIVPYEIQTFATQISVSYQAQTSGAYSAALASSAPAIFTANASGTGAAAALNQDGSVNSATNPANAGSVIVLFATGEGQTTLLGWTGGWGRLPIRNPISR